MAAQKQLPHSTADWQGYTLDELRYMRAYTAARIEINRERLTARMAEITDFNKKGAGAKGIVGRIIGAMSYIDMAVIVWKISSSAFRLFRSVRRR
ncbi:MAG: hypothetical protein J1E29_07345 [Duncaniella sp.]|nr:hypothetical protein [Duncaniella sp.]